MEQLYANYDKFRVLFRAKYSAMDQLKFVEDSL